MISILLTWHTFSHHFSILLVVLDFLWGDKSYLLIYIKTTMYVQKVFSLLIFLIPILPWSWLFYSLVHKNHFCKLKRELADALVLRASWPNSKRKLVIAVIKKSLKSSYLNSFGKQLRVCIWVFSSYYAFRIRSNTENPMRTRIDGTEKLQRNKLAPFSTLEKPTCGFKFSRETDNRKKNFGILPSNLVKWRSQKIEKVSLQ